MARRTAGRRGIPRHARAGPKNPKDTAVVGEGLTGGIPVAAWKIFIRAKIPVFHWRKYSEHQAQLAAETASPAIRQTPGALPRKASPKPLTRKPNATNGDTSGDPERSRTRWPKRHPSSVNPPETAARQPHSRASETASTFPGHAGLSGWFLMRSSVEEPQGAGNAKGGGAAGPDKPKKVFRPRCRGAPRLVVIRKDHAPLGLLEGVSIADKGGTVFGVTISDFDLVKCP